jgi:hypothetical protein
VNLRFLLPLAAAAFVMSCGPSTTRVADCTGICAGGTTCDFISGRCVAPPGSGGGSGGGNGVSGLPCDVAGVLAAKCISCHGTTPSGGAPNSLVTRDDLLKTSNLGGTIASRCTTRVQDTQSPMPPAYTGDSASASDVAALTGWVNANYPGGACASAGQTASGGGAGGGSGGGTATGGGSGGGSATGGGSGGGTATGGGSGGGTSTGGGTGGGTSTGGGGGATGGGGGTTSSAYCRACTSDAQCGGTNNYCLGFSFGDFCGTDCTASGTCATGQRCANIIDNSTMAVIGRNCVPVTGSTCAGSGSGGGGGTTGGGGGSTGGGGGATGGGGGTTCTTDTWANYGASFFANNCTNCHTGHHTGEFTTKSFVVTYKSSITSRISSGNMPPAGLTSADKTRILKYLSCGVP